MSTIPKKYLQKLRSDLHAYALVRRDVIKMSDDALHHAKRAIFALHRENTSEAKGKLQETEALLAELRQRCKKDPRIADEGAYRAAQEEYVEAAVFFRFVTTGKIGEVKIPTEGDIYLAGLCDVPGELYRLAIRAATKKDMTLVKHCADTAAEIIGELIEFNLTSYLRTKFDQAKQAAHKLEDIVYETSIRNM